MPLNYYRSHSECEVTLWKIEESKSFFRDKLIEEEFPTNAGDGIANDEKALQWYASRYLMLVSHPAAIDFYKERKPHLYNGPQISFSHSKNMVGILLSQKNAGLDLQVFDEKLVRIKDKYASDQDVWRINAPTDIAALSLVWSVKEAVFKYYGTGVPFKSIIVEKHDPISNIVTVSLQREQKTVVHKLVGDFLDNLSLAYVIE